MGRLVLIFAALGTLAATGLSLVGVYAAFSSARWELMAPPPPPPKSIPASPLPEEPVAEKWDFMSKSPEAGVPPPEPVAEQVSEPEPEPEPSPTESTSETTEPKRPSAKLHKAKLKIRKTLGGFSRGRMKQQGLSGLSDGNSSSGARFENPSPSRLDDAGPAPDSAAAGLNDSAPPSSDSAPAQSKRSMRALSAPGKITIPGEAPVREDPPEQFEQAEQ